VESLAEPGEVIPALIINVMIPGLLRSSQRIKVFVIASLAQLGKAIRYQIVNVLVLKIASFLAMTYIDRIKQNLYTCNKLY
jgi:hypothetical protein